MKELAERVASYVHLCTLYWWLRYRKLVCVLCYVLYWDVSLLIVPCVLN